MSDTLDVGVHPGDARQHPSQHASAPVPHDTARPMGTRGHAAWSVPNRRALPVFQRLADDFATGVYVASSTIGGGTVKITGRRKGRTRLTLWVPSSYFPGGGTLTPTPAGVIVSEDEGKAQQGEGVPLFVGDSMDVSSEASVWASVQPGQATGVVAWVDCWDAEALGSET